MPRFAPLLVVAGLLTFAAPARADIMDGSPGQDTMDGTMASSLSGGTWADMPDGRNTRPFIKSLSLINGASSETVYTGGPGGQGPTEPGDVTAVVGPINLCGPGQAPTSGQCYASPNRVGVVFGYVRDGGIGRDFAHPTVPLRQAVTPDTILDVVIGLNTIGRPLRWTWANGDLVDWKTTALGTPDAEIHLRIHPALTPEIDWSRHPPTGCTAVPVRDCELDRADGEYLSSNLVLSLDTTLPDALTGAVFATQRAIIGFLQPGGSSAAPVLDLEMASAHLRPDGSPQLGTLQAFLPAAGLRALYGVAPEQATSLFSATRVGDPGTSDPPVFTARAETDTSSAGLLVTVANITFSAPTYRLKRRTTGATPLGALPGPGRGATPLGGSPSAKGATVRLLRASSRRGVTLLITRARPGKASVTLSVRGRTVARATARVRANGRATLAVKLSPRARRLLRRVRTAKLHVLLPGAAPHIVSVTLSRR